jgi:antitoxin MazE
MELLQQVHLTGEVDLRPKPEGLLITPVVTPRRQGWDALFLHAFAQGQAPEGEMLEGFSNGAFEETEWQW